MVRKIEKASTIYNDIAKAVKVKPNLVAKILVAARDVIARELNRNSCARVPALANFKLRDIPARAAKNKKCFGKEVFVKAKPATMSVRVIPTKQLKDAVMG